MRIAVCLFITGTHSIFVQFTYLSSKENCLEKFVLKFKTFL